jgi:hypothetical protein
MREMPGMQLREIVADIGLAEVYDGFDLSGFTLDLQGWNSSHPYFDAFINELKPAQIIEIGTWKGASAINMARLSRRYRLDPTLFCVDTWLGSNAVLWKDPELRGLLLRKNGLPTLQHQFIANVLLSGLQDTIFPLPMTSICAAELLEMYQVSADLIYIDAGHGEYEVYGDVVNYWKILRPGGVMVGDDYHESWPGVVRAVTRFAADSGLKVMSSGAKWAIRKLG